MLRDFSEEAQAELLSYVEECSSESIWGKIGDFFGGIGLTVQEWIGKLSLENYIDNVDEYHKLIIDKNDTSAAQINQIFEDVEAVNCTYTSNMQALIDEGSGYLTILNALAECVRTDRRYFTSGKINEIVACFVAGEQEGEPYYEVVDDATLIALLSKCGWNEKNITPECLADLKRILAKYDISTEQQVAAFLAECTFESQYGKYTYERGNEEYFAGKAYGSKYRGAGYIHLTWEYGYQAFATYLILQEYPELKEYASYKNPNSNGSASISAEYKKVLKAAEQLNLDVSQYTVIVNEGYTSLRDDFAWESAGYFWDINNVNAVIENGGTIDDVSKIVNRYDTKTFPDRKKIYDKIYDGECFIL